MTNFKTFLTALAAVALLSDCGGGGGYGGGGGGGGTTTYTIGGTVAGLSASTSVVLANGADMVTVSANGSFSFPIGLVYFDPYNVTVQTQPTGRTCVVINGAGNVPFANVTNVTVACTSNTTAPALNDLVITEVLANPAGGASQEWFEVLNTNASARDLGGVVVTSGSGLFVVPAGTSIPSGAFFVFASSSDPTANGGLPAVNVTYGGSLQLVNANFSMSVSVAGTVVDSVSFTGAMPSAASLALSESHTDPAANDTQSNWCTSTTAYGTAGNKGTPGAANADCP